MNASSRPRAARAASGAAPDLYVGEPAAIGPACTYLRPHLPPCAPRYPLTYLLMHIRTPNVLDVGESDAIGRRLEEHRRRFGAANVHCVVLEVRGCNQRCNHRCSRLQTCCCILLPCCVQAFINIHECRNVRTSNRCRSAELYLLLATTRLIHRWSRRARRPI